MKKNPTHQWEDLSKMKSEIVKPIDPLELSDEDRVNKNPN